MAWLVSHGSRRCVQEVTLGREGRGGTADVILSETHLLVQQAGGAQRAPVQHESHGATARLYGGHPRASLPTLRGVRLTGFEPRLFSSPGAQQRGEQVTTDGQTESRDTFLIESHKWHR